MDVQTRLQLNRISRVLRTLAFEITAGLLPGGSTASRIVDELLQAPKRDVDERISKIDAARENLQEALAAIDDLKENAEESQKELKRLQISLEQNEVRKGDLLTDIEELKRLGTISQNTIRRAFGIPKKWQVYLGYLVSFLVGIATTFFYDFYLKGLPTKWFGWVAF
ncbi:hypothetical protein ASG19_04560 [Rhizobium sp. Leaf306]|uniref:hypothetical protein n=1 Tax=Rhizobium sp. Leaf306 TaxID=1736330 RepID=UPI0007156DDA|nr:hypothetical protein [Rhizobium sp. Leaf306]KQQ38330.1 hypothetical protein ASG19_04560 [Rhizobium sp. Leaf306]